MKGFTNLLGIGVDNNEEHTMSTQLLEECAAPQTCGNGRKTVLIVDDNEVFLPIFAEWLKLVEKDLTVLTAENGSEAVAVLRTEHVDLVITDLRMPVMDGSELMLWLSESKPAMPVIIMSAFSDIDTVLHIESQGNYFFDKPLDYEGLAHTVHALLV